MAKMISFQQLERLVARAYADLRTRWYQGLPSVPPTAKLKVEDDVHTSGYRSQLDTIHLFIPHGNLEDFDLDDSTDLVDCDRWPLWKIELVHEMLHEYQAKSVTSPSPGGLDLHSRFHHRFLGPGHDATFFTAVDSFASTFGIDAERLIARL